GQRAGAALGRRDGRPFRHARLAPRNEPEPVPGARGGERPRRPPRAAAQAHQGQCGGRRMRIEFVGEGEVVVPGASGPWRPGEAKEITDPRLAEGLLRRPDFREVEEAAATPRRKRGAAASGGE